MSTTAEILQAQKRKLQKTLDNKASIKQAITNKRGGIDIGENQSTWASEIESIEPLLDTLDITENGKHNVKDYKNVDVFVKGDYFNDLEEILSKQSYISYEVPYGIKVIGPYGVYGYNNVYLPNTITHIQNSAIMKDSYTSSVIYFNGSFTEYMLIIKGTLDNANSFFPIRNGSMNVYFKNKNNEYIQASGNVKLTKKFLIYLKVRLIALGHNKIIQI